MSMVTGFKAGGRNGVVAIEVWLAVVPVMVVECFFS